MFVMTMTKRRLLRIIMLILVLLTGIAIGVFAILSSIDTAAEGIKLPIYKVQRNDNRIAVTFDCAWGNSNTDKLIEILDNADIKATFFVTGEFCDKYPDDIKKLHAAGHEIENHSDTHPHPVGMNLNDLIEDTKSCSAKIEKITGTAPLFYRAPYGEYDDKVITTINGMGIKAVQWSVDSIDWDKPDKETIINRTTKNIAPGDILLFHNDLENTEQALPEILTSLKEQGFEPVALSELIYNEDYTIDNNGMQIKTDTTAAVYNTFSENALVNQAFISLSKNLTVADIEQMATGGMTPEIAEKTVRFLSAEQIAAVQELSYEELKELFALLQEAVYTRGNEPQNYIADEESSEDYSEEIVSNDSELSSEESSAESTEENSSAPDKELRGDTDRRA